jgi:arsenate reductase (thioredoxin)
MTGSGARASIVQSVYPDSTQIQVNIRVSKEELTVKHILPFILFVLAALQLPLASPAAPTTAGAAPETVVFVCEHGNVKSLMAASYFNQIARQRNLPFVAIARGTAPNSTTVPAAIVAGLRTDGVDVSAYRPLPVVAHDLASARQIVLIETALPAALQAKAVPMLDWNDVPPASVNFAAARQALENHVGRLVDDLAKARSN